ncbi:MAG: choice-of-anchor A family protein [Myxococcales bacterium]
MSRLSRQQRLDRKKSVSVRLCARGEEMRTASHWLGLGLSLVLSSSGASAGTSNSTVLGFEAASDWHLTEGSGALASVAPLSEGAHALQLGGSGWRRVKTDLLMFGSVGPALKVDLAVGGPTESWETINAVIEIPSANIYWQELGTQSVGGMNVGQQRTFEFTIPQSVRTALENGNPAQLSFAVNSPQTVIFDHGTAAETPVPPPAPPAGSVAGGSPTCTDRTLAISDIQADFRDIWLGRETVATGKRTDQHPKISLTFSMPVQPQRVSAHLVGLTDAGADCVKFDGDMVPGTKLHDVALSSDYGAEAWQSPLSIAAGAQSAPLDFNLVSFGDVSGVPHIEGAVAAGGNLTLQSFSINATTRKPTGMVVRGKLTASNGTLVGDLAHGSSIVSLQSVQLQGQQLQALPFDFDELEAGLDAMSRAMAGRQANGAVSTLNGALRLLGDEAGLNVFEVTAAQLASASSIRIETPPNAVALVNVSGTSISLGNLQISLAGVSKSGLLWNLPTATSFRLRSISFQGSALAPLALADISNGNFEGTLVAGSVIGNMEFHAFPLSSWQAFGAATLSTTVSLTTNARLRAGCEYQLIVDPFPATPSGSCLPQAFDQPFLVADNAKSKFDREMSKRRFQRLPNLPVSFQTHEGINTLVTDAFSRYADVLAMRSGVDGLAAQGRLFPSPLAPSLESQRYRQLYRGIPVDGYGWLVTNEGGFFRSAVGQVMPGLSVDTNPALTSAAAVTAAITKLALPSLPWQGGSASPTAELVLKPQGFNSVVPEARLLWRVRFSDIDVDYVDVDAQSGAVRFIQKRSVGISACQNYDHSLATFDHQETRNVDIAFDDTHTSTESNLAVGIWKMGGDPFEVFQNRAPFNYRTRFEVERDGTTPDVTESVCAGADDDTKLVARAHWALQNATDAFSEVLGWQGVTGDPLADNLVMTVIKQLPNHNDAFFLPRQGATPDSIRVTESYNYPDVVAHELGHAMSYYSRAKKGLPPRGLEAEAGAIEEAYGDIMASVAIEHVEAPNVWCRTEAGGASCKRDLADPSSGENPDTYLGEHWGAISEDCGDFNDHCSVHTNATVVGHWFQTLVEGQDASSVNDFSCASSVLPLALDPEASMAAAARVAFDAFSSLDANAGFLAARILSAQVAEDQLLDPSAKLSVEKAWAAVGVGEGPTPLDFSPEDGATDVDAWDTPLRFTVGDDLGPWVVRWSKDPSFQSANYQVITSASFDDGVRYATAHVSLDEDAKYYWQGKEGGENSAQADWDKCGTFSAAFSTGAKEIKLNIPDHVESNGYYQTDHDGTVYWERVEFADSYDALLSEVDDGCNAPAEDWTNILPNIHTFLYPQVYLGDTVDENGVLLRDPAKLWPTRALDPDVTYHLYLRARASNGAKGKCNHFKVRKLKLLPFQKVSPLHYDSIAYDSGGPFVWTPSADADHYDLTIYRWPPGDVPAQVEKIETLLASDVVLNADGNVEYPLADTAVTTLPGEMFWEVNAVHASGDSRSAWDDGSPHFTNAARFWSSAEAITTGETENGTWGPPEASVIPISLVFPRDATERETQTCFPVVGNTAGMLWWFGEGGNVSHDDLRDARVAPDATGDYPLCTDRLAMTADSMWMLAIPYSNVVEFDAQPDWLYGYGPMQQFHYKVTYCGAVGDSCCQDGGPACADGGSCVGNKCVACGGKGEICCGASCDNAHLLCDSSSSPAKCKSCGEPGEPCCGGDKCDSGVMCSDHTCAPCGHAGEQCCPGVPYLTCSDSNTRCDGGSCKAIKQCNSEVHAGSNSAESFEIEMGKTEGWATLQLNTHTVPDDITVYYEGNPIVPWGCYGTVGQPAGCAQLGLLEVCCDGVEHCAIRFRYGPGSSTTLQVEVTPNCRGTSQTAWDFSVSCPQ